MEINLYKVLPSSYKYCYFVFATSRNRAKSMCVNFNSGDEEYADFRVKTLCKNAPVSKECVIDCDDSDLYPVVVALGFRFATEEEMDGQD